eukprot:363968-Chlamydomonas_euryale.AAC.5
MRLTVLAGCKGLHAWLRAEIAQQQQRTMGVPGSRRLCNMRFVLGGTTPCSMLKATAYHAAEGPAASSQPLAAAGWPASSQPLSPAGWPASSQPLEAAGWPASSQPLEAAGWPASSQPLAAAGWPASSQPLEAAGLAASSHLPCSLAGQRRLASVVRKGIPGIPVLHGYVRVLMVDI